METKIEMSQRFEFIHQKPWMPGVYEVDVWAGEKFIHNQYSYWNGWEFRHHSDDIELAEKWQTPPWHGCFVYFWRGLSSDPSAPKKRAGNKRKTMYVVLALWSDGMMKSEGVYGCPDLAKAHVKRLEKNKACDDTWFEKIRFRTPEA